MFEDIYEIMRKGKKIKDINVEKFFDKIIFSTVVQTEIRNRCEEYMRKSNS